MCQGLDSVTECITDGQTVEVFQSYNLDYYRNMRLIEVGILMVTLAYWFSVVLHKIKTRKRTKIKRGCYKCH